MSGHLYTTRNPQSEARRQFVHGRLKTPSTIQKVLDLRSEAHAAGLTKMRKGVALLLAIAFGAGALLAPLTEPVPVSALTGHDPTIAGETR